MKHASVQGHGRETVTPWNGGMAPPEPCGLGPSLGGPGNGGISPRPSAPPSRPCSSLSRRDSGFRLSLRASLPGAERGGSGRCREWGAAPGMAGGQRRLRPGPHGRAGAERERG